MRTASAGEAVAGIRYRARRLSAALHPTIPVHTPLVFDLIDTWKSALDRSLHLLRRSTRRHGPHYAPRQTPRKPRAPPAALPGRHAHRLTPSLTPQEEHNPVFPMTLDLRWPAPQGRAMTGLPRVSP